MDSRLKHMEDDESDPTVCDATGPLGYGCTHPANHIGYHAACGMTNGVVFDIWNEVSPVKH